VYQSAYHEILQLYKEIVGASDKQPPGTHPAGANAILSVVLQK
jgi:hypothetical protein